MKRLISSFVAVLLMEFVNVLAGQEIESPEWGKLRLELKTDKREYVLGELVQLKFRMVPVGGNVRAPQRITVTNGGLRVFMAITGSGSYNEYIGPGWNAERNTDMTVVRLRRGQTVEATATLLYHIDRLRASSSISPGRTKRVLSEGRISQRILSRRT